MLAKKPKGEAILKEEYRQHEGQLNSQLRWERSARRTDISERDFVEFYPYPPHFIDLSIDIMAGIRLEPGGPRQLGGSNRTIIKQAFEMLASERTNLGRAAVGRLVTLDLVFELVEGNLSTEKRKDISDIGQRFGDTSWEARTAKAVALLELVRDLPRTEANVAAVLVDMVDSSAPVPQVTTALERLQEAKYVRHTEEGYKLQTASEKNWETERRAIDPKPRDRVEIVRQALQEVFTEPGLRTYSYKGLRNFRVGLTVDEVRLEDGQIPLHIVTAETHGDFEPTRERTQTQSREDPRQIFWAFALTPEIDATVAELFRSRQMVNKYDQLKSQGKLASSEEATCLANEKQEVPRIQGQLRKQIEQALQGGTGLFQGRSKDGAALGKTVAEVFRRVFDEFAPELYAKLELGAKPLKEHAAEEFLKAANLSGLPPVFYEGEQGYGLVKKEGTKYVVNREAPVASEILAFIRQRADYGEKVSGRDLDQQFGGLGYGWERDLIQTVLAVLLRVGAIEVTYQGRRFRNHQDPVARAPFTTMAAFRNASYAPRETIGLKTLATAAERYEELTGQEVDVEESAIAQAFKKVAEQEQAELLPLLAKVQAYRLPVETDLADHRATIEQIGSSATDDCVRILAEEGRSLKEAINRTRRIREALSDGNLSTLNHARQVMGQMWPAIRARPEAAEMAPAVEKLQSLASSPTFYEALGEIAKLASEVEKTYATIYERVHEERSRVVLAEIETIKGHPGWVHVPDELKAALLAPLETRACAKLERPAGAQVCQTCRATIGQIESDIAAAQGLRAQVVGKIQEVSSSKPVRRIRIAALYDQPLDSEASVQQFMDLLREQLMKLVAEGVLIVVE